MMAIRSICNLFKTEEGRAVATDEFDRLHELVQPFITSSHRNLLIAVTTLYTNYSVLLSSNSNADRALSLLADLAKILNNATDSEAVYRALVATGTLLSLGDEYCEAGRDVFDVNPAVSRAEENVKEPRIKNVVAEIREKLKA
jgi:phospholipase A-2-activating protein